MRLFLSYARRDGADLALRLQRDLAPLEVWLDRLRLKAGDRWTNEIEDALNRADVVLALVTEGSFASDTCRAEQNWSVDKGKRVIPIRVNGNVPLRLYHLQYVDFSDPAQYAQSLGKLRDALDAPSAHAPAVPPSYNNAPPLPANFVDRPDILVRLRDALFLDAPNRNIALTALAGMGGIGKTVLAQALCHDPVVRRAYPDGIFWITIGRESTRGFDQRIEAVPGLHTLLGEHQGEAACISQYRNAFREKAALIVLDDVWSAGDIEPFQTESPRSRLLVTTRDAGIAPTFGAREFTAELPADAEAREVLARWAGLAAGALPPQANEVLEECGNLPLALAMIGAQLKGKPPAWWEIILGHLRRADLAKIKARFPEPHTTLFRAVEVSVDALRAEDPAAARRYLALAVLLEDMPAASAVQQTLWNADESAALETAGRLIELGLAQRDGETALRLHDLQLDYVRSQYPDQEALALIRGAVRLSAHVIENHPREFASQVVGRLLLYRESPSIQQFMDEAVAGAPLPWLRSVHPSLHPPGTELVCTLEGHSAYVTGVAVTPDGRVAVSTSADHTLKVWDMETGRALRTLKGHSTWVTGVVITPDGKWVVSVSGDHTLKVWDLETGSMLRTLQEHSAGGFSVAVTPDGKRAVSASVDKTLKVWDLRSGSALLTLEGHTASVDGVAVMPDGKRAVSASRDKTLAVWDLATGRTIRTLEGHSGWVTGVVVSPDGKHAISASADHTLKVWDLETGCALRTLEGHSAGVSGVVVSSDGKRAISASGDRTLKVWDLESGRVLRTLEGHSASVDGVAVTLDGRRVVSASRDKTLKVWDLETSRALCPSEGHSDSVFGMAVTPDRKRAVSASRDKTLKVWDLETGRALRTLKGHSNWVTGVVITPDGKRAVSASWDKTLKVWDLETGLALLTLEGHSNWVSGVAMTSDGKRAISASWDKTLIVWDLETGRALHTLESDSAAVSGLGMTPDGKRAVLAFGDKTMRVWDLETGRALRALDGHSEAVSSVAVTADGKWAVSASGDKTLKLWNLDTGRAVRTLEGHSASIHGVGLTAGGNRAVSASEDRTVKVWDLDTGRNTATFHCEASARCCAFIDHHRIIAGDVGGRIYFLFLEEFPKR